MPSTEFEFWPKPEVGERFAKKVVNKFGRAEISNAYQTICFGADYQMPQTATQLRIKAGGNADDTAGGAGAQEILIQGLDQNGNEIEETLATAGASQSAFTQQSFLRAYKMFVTKTGTYYNDPSSIQPGVITVEDGSGNDWMVLENNQNVSFNQAEIGAYTVPNGFDAYIGSFVVSVDGRRPVDIFLAQRQDVTAQNPPFAANRIVFNYEGLSGIYKVNKRYLQGIFPSLTDLVVYAKTNQGNSLVIVDFEIVLIDSGD